MEDLLPLEKLLSQLKKPHNGKTLIHVLSSIRKHVNSANHRHAIDQIKRSNSLKQLLYCTQFDNNLRVIDLTLSILGNCCMNSSVVRFMVHGLNILQNLLRVLDKHKKDSILGRVFRIFGNLTDSVEPIHLFCKEPKIITFTLEFLRNFAQQNEENQSDLANSTVSTISMALRFVRKMLSIRTYLLFTEHHNFNPILGLVLIKCTEMWKHNQSDDILVNDVIKIFQIITSTSYVNRNMLRELRTTQNGDALETFSHIILLQPERLTKVILRLRHLSELHIEPIVKTLITEVEKQPRNIEGTQSRLMLCVCELMDHPATHDLILHAGIVTSLVKLLESTNISEEWSLQCCIFICKSLNKFQYVLSIVHLQLSVNIIPIIIRKLQTLTGKSIDRIAIQSHVKREYAPCAKRRKRDFEDTGRNIDRYIDICASPSSCSDVSSCGPFSPTATSNFTGDESDSDDYSPLCSDNECEEDDKEEPEERQDLSTSDTDEIQPKIQKNLIHYTDQLRYELCALLKVYCIFKPKHAHLTDTKLIILLINLLFDPHFSESKHKKEDYLIKTMSLSHDYLIPFMSSDVFTQLYEVLDQKHSCCSECDLVESKVQKLVNNFIKVGHMETTKGDIAYILLAKEKINVKLKEEIAVSIPYVIRNRITLKRLLSDCGGLDLLLRLLSDEENEEMQTRSIKSICALATINLNISNPVKRVHSPRKVPISDQRSMDVDDNVVTFHLEDGSSVEALRVELMHHSDYFKALLGGSFVEAQSRHVTLKDASKEAIMCLLRYLNADVKGAKLVERLETMLEVIRLADRFLLSGLMNVLLYKMEKSFTMEKVPTIYKWSIESRTNIMRIECVAYALVNNHSYGEKVDLMLKLLQLGYTHELVDDMRNLIYQFL